ncbi:ABC transporter permease [archaeon]|nr:ABC transporter permease [archaeon]NDB55544.1 ABC transporter permease [archaeon]NDB79395.1 ABC transporter permease [archaeon]
MTNIEKSKSIIKGTQYKINKKDYELLIRDIANSIKIREGTVLDTTLQSESWYEAVWKRLNENKYAMYSFYYTIFVMALAILYPIFISANPTDTYGAFTATYGGSANAYPTLRHPFGTDNIGRDIMTLVIAGTYNSMLVGFFSTVLFLSIGFPLGLIAGYYGGRTAEFVLRLADFFLAIPFLLIAILGIQLVTKYGGIFADFPVPVIILIVLGLFGWAGTTRLVYSTTLQVLTEEYIAAARTIGLSDFRIISKHIIPNVLSPVIVVGTLGIAGGILAEAGLTFLGFGDILADVSWGTIISIGVPNIILHSNQVIIPGFAVFFIAIAVNLLGDALRDALDPRLKK